MYTTKSGQKFGSAFVGKKKDAMHSDDAKHEAGESKQFEKGEQEGMKEKPEADENAPEQVVAKHKPAHTVIVKHDKKTGRHTVTSHHSDGFSHQSEHSTPEEAHSAAATLGGAEAMPAATDVTEAAPQAGLPMPRLA